MDLGLSGRTVMIVGGSRGMGWLGHGRSIRRQTCRRPDYLRLAR